MIVIFVISLLAGLFAVINAVESKAISDAEKVCSELGSLYDVDYRHSTQTGCELYIDSPMWVEVQ